MKYLNKLDELDQLVNRRGQLQEMHRLSQRELPVIEDNIKTLMKDIEVLEKKIMRTAL